MEEVAAGSLAFPGSAQMQNPKHSSTTGSVWLTADLD